MYKYTIISDLVIDDLLAQLLLQKLTNNTPQTIISTFGNIAEDQAFRNAQELIALKLYKWSLVHGSKVPLSGKHEYEWLTAFNGNDGWRGIHPDNPLLSFPRPSINSGWLMVSLSNQKRESMDPQVKPEDDKINKYKVHSSPGLEEIISLGSLTDLYKIISGKNSAGLRITIMGGVFNDKGNFGNNTFAECNIGYDPDAADKFFTGIQNQEVRVVPLDVTRKIFWDEKTIDLIPDKHGWQTWVKKVIKDWYINYGNIRGFTLKLHDPLAVYLTFFPEEAEWEEHGVSVILEGEQRGRTVFCDDNPKCKIAMSLKNSVLIQKNIFKLIFEQ